MTALGQLPQSPLSRMVGRTPMQPVAFTLLRSTFWSEHGVVIAHIEELPAEIRDALTRWATVQFGRRMKR